MSACTCLINAADRTVSERSSCSLRFAFNSQPALGTNERTRKLEISKLVWVPHIVRIIGCLFISWDYNVHEDHVWSEKEQKEKIKVSGSYSHIYARLKLPYVPFITNLLKFSRSFDDICTHIQGGPYNVVFLNKKIKIIKINFFLILLVYSKE